jgi:hypothetical protein
MDNLQTLWMCVACRTITVLQTARPVSMQVMEISWDGNAVRGLLFNTIQKIPAKAARVYTLAASLEMYIVCRCKLMILISLEKGGASQYRPVELRL